MTYILTGLIVYLILVLFFWFLCAINKEPGRTGHRLNLQNSYSHVRGEEQGRCTKSQFTHSAHS